MKNIYKYSFMIPCPNNGKCIEYHLEIHSLKTIMVEEIVSKCASLGPNFHEYIADYLSSEFDGFQILKAHHHGVDIETYRGKF